MKDRRQHFANNHQKWMEASISNFINTYTPNLYDIGAGCKTEAYTLKQIFKNMKVFGCEPNPKEYHRIRKTYPGQLLNAAIARGSYVTLWNCGNPLNASLIKHRPNSQPVEVPAMTLDQFDEWAEHQDEIVLWIDIEGFELQALKTGPELLRSGRVHWLNVEERKEDYEEDPSWTRRFELQDFLASYGYERITTYNNHKSHCDVIYKREGVVNRWSTLV